MPRPSPKARQLAKNKLLAEQQLNNLSTQFEERYQSVVQEFHAAKLRFRAVSAQYRAVQQEREWLQHVVNTKQQVIEELLPYYPHPLTPELLSGISLY